MTRLEGLFLSTDVELRIAAGEAMVMLLETAYDFDEVKIFFSMEIHVLSGDSYPFCFSSHFLPYLPLYLVYFYLH